MPNESHAQIRSEIDRRQGWGPVCQLHEVTWQGHTDLAVKVDKIDSKLDLLAASLSESKGANKTKAVVFAACLTISSLVLGIVSTRGFVLSDSVQMIDTRLAVIEKVASTLEAKMATDEAQTIRFAARLTDVEKNQEVFQERCARPR